MNTITKLILTLHTFVSLSNGNSYGISPHIIGGELVDVSNYPYQIEILYMNMHFCGGCLISDRWVLTAAQCTQIATQSILYSVRAGTNYRERDGQVRGVIKIINHPDYHYPKQYNNDISLLQISRSFIPSVLIQAIQLPAVNHILYPGDTAVVSGWGYEDPSGQPTDELHAVKIPVISRSSCTAAYGEEALSDRMICAGSPYGGRDACIDDGGGPLVVEGVVVGLVSWGYGCASAKYPGVYTSVIALRQWIKDISGV